MSFDPYANLVGGFSTNDGTMDFYLRINSLLKPEHTVLDMGAGRAAWFEDDTCQPRKEIRMLKGKVKKVIAADVDDAVLENRASDSQVVMKDGKLDLPDASVDLVVADYVLEHIEDPETFAAQVDAVLRPGGWFCARTPHKISYVSIASRLVANKAHTKVLKYIQPDRKEIDVFPAFYRMNSVSDVRKAFPGWNNQSFTHRIDPAYHFNSKLLHSIQDYMHRVLFSQACGNLFVYVQKPEK